MLSGSLYQNGYGMRESCDWTSLYVTMTIASQSGDFTLAGGKQIMESFIETYRNKINVVYAHNEDMALGTIQPMAADKMNVDEECSPLLGPQLMSAVKDVVAGKTLPKRILTQETVVPMSVAAQTLCTSPSG